MTAVWLQRGADGFDAVERFISEKIWGKAATMPGNTVLVAIDRLGNSLGAAMFQNYNPDYGTVEISAAAVSPRWLSRSVLREMFEYPFLQLDCQAVVLRCGTNDKSLGRIFTAYGFKRYDIPRLRGRDKAEAVYILADDVWRANGFHKDNV